MNPFHIILIQVGVALIAGVLVIALRRKLARILAPDDEEKRLTARYRLRVDTMHSALLHTPIAQEYEAQYNSALASRGAEEKIIEGSMPKMNL